MKTWSEEISFPAFLKLEETYGRGRRGGRSILKMFGYWVWRGFYGIKWEPWKKERKTWWWEKLKNNLLQHRIHPPHIFTLPLHTLLSFFRFLHYILNATLSSMSLLLGLWVWHEMKSRMEEMRSKPDSAPQPSPKHPLDTAGYKEEYWSTITQAWREEEAGERKNMI